MVCYINLCSPKLQSVQSIILGGWGRHYLYYIFCLFKLISRIVSLLSLFFSPNRFQRLAGVYPPGWALKISSKEREGAWLNHQRNPAAHSQAILSPLFPVRPMWSLPGKKTPLRSGALRTLPQTATESSSCLLLPSDSITPFIRLCGCLFSAGWISSRSWDSHSTSLHLQSAARKGMLQIPGSQLWIVSLLVCCQTSGTLYK